MLKQLKNEKGIVLISVYGVVLTLLTMAGAYGIRSAHEGRLAQRNSESAAAFYLAEAGAHELIARIHDGQTFTDVGTPSNSTGVSLGDGEFWVEAFPTADPPYLISTGEVNGITRRIRVELGINIPAPANAINIFGSPTEHVIMSIHDHDGANENGEILVSGNDLSGGPDRLGVGVEDAATLTALIDKLGGDLKASGDLENTLVGSPMTDFTDSFGNEFTASLGTIDSQGFDADFMEINAQLLADNARAMTPTTTLTLTADKDDTFLDPYKDETGTVVLGGSSTDVIYIDGNGYKLELKNQADPMTIVGTGTLIVDGTKFNLEYTTFDWTGDIYILGGATGKKNDAEFKVKHATADIVGDIYLLSNSTNTEGKGKVKIEFDNEI